MDAKRIDTASEPVEVIDNDDMMDTGMLHERPNPVDEPDGDDAA